MWSTQVLAIIGLGVNFRKCWPLVFTEKFLKSFDLEVEFLLNSFLQVLEIIDLGVSSRSVAETAMNATYTFC